MPILDEDIVENKDENALDQFSPTWSATPLQNFLTSIFLLVFLGGALTICSILNFNTFFSIILCSSVGPLGLSIARKLKMYP
ncbi:hypothetical protein [Aureispira anguillae]|uniref:Uncharacterized protein n=1 Tax=Aureispira anguillae TaxID=2864201 RepID=A0A915YK63_9BACT|nr:hypothetical protein [Aureispira anguillae]BDS14714.1 hypothetical protein AsAng_0054950 [Aureispira anguillae]